MLALKLAKKSKGERGQKNNIKIVVNALREAESAN